MGEPLSEAQVRALRVLGETKIIDDGMFVFRRWHEDAQHSYNASFPVWTRFKLKWLGLAKKITIGHLVYWEITAAGRAELARREGRGT